MFIRLFSHRSSPLIAKQPLLVRRCFGHQADVLKDEAFMNKYYDSSFVPKESELNTDEFRTRLESWASYKMFTGVKMRKNGDWYAFYGKETAGPFETSVAAAKKWDELCYASEHRVDALNFPEKYWMRGEGLPNVSFFNPQKAKNKVEWVSPSQAKSKQYNIDVKKGKPLSLRETMQILTGENALNIRVLNLRNHTSMADWMIFVTGSSLSHQKRIGDTILRKRQLHNIPIRVTDRDESEWMVVDGDRVITNIFSPRYRMARDLEDQWELMRPGKNRYENWSEEELQERFGNVEEKMEAMSLESVIEGFQERVEKENQPVNEEAFHVSEEEMKGLKEEMKKEEEEEWEEKEYYMTREDFEKLKNPDGTITINGENLVIEGISDVKEGEIKDEEVPFVEVKKCVCLFDTEF
ncbi:hypothetical protein WA577_005663 [Blastocystis sp. JDR]